MVARLVPAQRAQAGELVEQVQQAERRRFDHGVRLIGVSVTGMGQHGKA